MARHFYFGYQFNVSGSSIGNKFCYIFLGVIAAIGSFSAHLHISPVSFPPFLPRWLRSPCGKVGKTRVGIYLEAPSGSICQVKMHPVHLEKSHCIHLLLEKVHTAEMA